MGTLAASTASAGWQEPGRAALLPTGPEELHAAARRLDLLFLPVCACQVWIGLL